MMSEPQQKRRWRRIDVVMALICATIFALFASAAAFIYLEKYGQQKAMTQANAQLDILKRRDIPVDAESLKALYVSSTSRDDTAAWLEVFERFNPKRTQHYIDGTSPYGPPAQTISDASLKRTLDSQRDLVTQHAELLKTIHILAKHQHTVQFDFNYSLTSSRNDLTYIHQLMKLLTDELQVGIADNNLDQIQQSLDAQFGVLHVLHGQNMLIDYVIFAAARATVYQNIKALLEKNLLDQQSLDWLSSSISKLPVDNWRSLVSCERALMLPYFQGQKPFVLPRSVPEDGSPNPTAKDYLNYLNYMERIESVDWSTWATAKRELEAIQADLQHQSDTMSVFEKHNWRMTLFSIADWTQIGEKFAQDLSERNQTYLACALRIYQKKHGTFPDKLEQLNDIGIDPAHYLSIAEVPFGYEVKDNVAYLWGPVRTDDHKLPLHISPTIPLATSDTTASQQENINQAVWTLPP